MITRFYSSDLKSNFKYSIQKRKSGNMALGLNSWFSTSSISRSQLDSQFGLYIAWQ